MYNMDFETLDTVVGVTVNPSGGMREYVDDLEKRGSFGNAFWRAILTATLGYAVHGTADDTVVDDFLRDVENAKPDTWKKGLEFTIDFAKKPTTVEKVIESFESDSVNVAKKRMDMTEEMMDNLNGLQNDPDGKLATKIAECTMGEALNKLNDINNIEIKKELERKLPNEEYRKLMKIAKKKWWHFWKK